jgi:thymidylate synthase
LLTNFPGENGNDSINQLELNVISKLCRGESSRNMYITLANPLLETVQQSCSSVIQFSVSAETLDMTVNQRSSDVVLGLPNDVVVWAVIYHLVRREVKMER